LVFMLFKRDFVAFYKQTILGPLWYVIQPILTSIAFTLIFNKIAQIPTGGVPPFLFYLSGVVQWSFFSNCMGKTSDTFVSNAGIFGKVYFPRLVVPVSTVLSNLLTYLIQFLLLIAVMIYYWQLGSNIRLGLDLVLLVPLLLYTALLGLGVGIIISSLTTRFRDLNFVVGFATQLWMYATPVIYPLSQIPEKWHWLIALNPMTAPMETFRHLLFGGGIATFSVWLSSIVVTTVLVAVGLVLFSRVEKTSMDTV